jgi:hypothetical protein
MHRTELKTQHCRMDSPKQGSLQVCNWISKTHSRARTKQILCQCDFGATKDVVSGS